jgi:PAT family beta-lactamase induction signal transducer AmpG
MLSVTPALVVAAREIGAFVVDAFKAFIGSRAAAVGVLFAVLPGGAYALGLALQSNLAVEFGMNDSQVGALNLWSSVISAVFCIAGGWLSDRFGRRGTLAWTMAATGIPTLILAWSMQQHGWVHVVPTGAPDRPVPDAALLQMFWGSVLVYNLFQGLYYGIRSALFMDVTTPRVAATQFTAYMALMNLAISYSARWQGWAVERWGYPVTLAADAILGLVCLLCLPFMTPQRKPAAVPPGAALPESLGPV